MAQNLESSSQQKQFSRLTKILLPIRALENGKTIKPTISSVLKNNNHRADYQEMTCATQRESFKTPKKINSLGNQKQLSTKLWMKNDLYTQSARCPPTKTPKINVTQKPKVIQIPQQMMIRSHQTSISQRSLVQIKNPSTIRALPNKFLNKTVLKPKLPLVTPNYQQTIQKTKSERIPVMTNRLGFTSNIKSLKTVMQQVQQLKASVLPLNGDSMNEETNNSEYLELKSCGDDFEVANEDWDEPQLTVRIGNTSNLPQSTARLENYRNNDCLQKIFKLQKASCMCTESACTSYCTKLTAKQQRKVIKELMIVRSSQMAKSQTERNLLGEKRYILIANWWRKWCDYVNFKQRPSSTLSSEASMAQEDFATFYDKPTSIKNAPLLDQDFKLQSNLVEHFDYEVVSSEVWKHFNSWYQSDHQICRRLVRDRLNQVKLDLYPETVRMNTQFTKHDANSSQSFEIISEKDYKTARLQVKC